MTDNLSEQDVAAAIVNLAMKHNGTPTQTVCASMVVASALESATDDERALGLMGFEALILENRPLADGLLELTTFLFAPALLDIAGLD